ncbi:hypothetical protein PoB_002012000 [Plakobranchus ocellatus]|uniref:Secreted protein n=1 Tax=Plakobranchus ocellatus TaxID=259542 RepID=A0AAV3ZEN1_9GAST|nr:hypothetical protein PoB_002012000 [Plakobranchus ocellatus]
MLVCVLLMAPFTIAKSRGNSKMHRKTTRFIYRQNDRGCPGTSENPEPARYPRQGGNSCSDGRSGNAISKSDRPGLDMSKRSTGRSTGAGNF